MLVTKLKSLWMQIQHWKSCRTTNNTECFDKSKTNEIYNLKTWMSVQRWNQRLTSHFVAPQIRFVHSITLFHCHGSSLLSFLLCTLWLYAIISIRSINFYLHRICIHLWFDGVAEFANSEYQFAFEINAMFSIQSTVSCNLCELILIARIRF